MAACRSRRSLTVAIVVALATLAGGLAIAAPEEWPLFWRGRLDPATSALLDEAYASWAADKAPDETWKRAAAALAAALEAQPATSDPVELLRRGQAWTMVGEWIVTKADIAQKVQAYDRGLVLLEASGAAGAQELLEQLNDDENFVNDLRGRGLAAAALPLAQQVAKTRERVQGGDQLDTARALDALANVYQALAQHAQALPLFERSVAITEKASGPTSRETAVELNNLGNQLQLMGRVEEALPPFQRSLSIFDRIRGISDRDFVVVLDNLAYAYEKLGRYADAQPIRLRATEARAGAAGADPLAIANAYRDLGNKYAQAQQYELALRFYERARALYKAAGDAVGDASVLVNVADAYERMGRYDVAQPLRQQFFDITVETVEPKDTALALLTVGDLYRSAHQYQLALPFYERGLALARKGFPPDSVDLASALNRTGGAMYDAYRYAEALALQRQSLAIYQGALGDMNSSTATVMNNVASDLMSLALYAQALPVYVRSLAIWESISGAESLDAAVSVAGLGAAYVGLGRYAEALPLLQRNLSIYERLQGAQSEGVAAALALLADLHFALGQFPSAISVNERALAIYEKVKGRDAPETAYVLGQLAMDYRMAGRSEEGVPLAERSLAIREASYGPVSPVTARALNQLAILYRRVGRDAEAEKLYERSLAIYEKSPGPRSQSAAQVLNNMGEQLVLMGRPAEAIPRLVRAEVIASSKDWAPLSWHVQKNLGQAYAALGQPGPAIFWDKQAVNSLQRLRAGLVSLDRDTQEGFVTSQIHDIYTHLSDLLIAQGRIPEAQSVMRMLKDEEYFSFVQRDAASDPRQAEMPLTGVEKATNERFYAVRNRLAALGEEQRAILERQLLGTATPADLKRLEAIDGDLQAAAKAFDDFVAGLQASLAGNAATAATSRQVADQLRTGQSLLADLEAAGQHAAALQYVVSEQRLHIIVTTANLQLAHEVVITPSALNAKILAFREASQNPGIDPRPIGRELYALLIEPARKDLEDQRIDTLMLVLDDTLRYVPFAALTSGDQYLVEQYKLALYTEGAQARLATQGGRPWQVAALGVTQGVPELGLQPLDSVGDELHGIVQPDVLPGTVKLDHDFTKAALQASLRTPVLHIASHFNFVPGSDESFLLLGDGGRLTLREVRLGMRFDNVELLTLSACNTATGGGQRENGAEVEGLGRLAQDKGARAVLATLWPVADRSTGLLMQDFYREHQQRHLDKAAALRAAQLAMLHGTLRAESASASAARGAKRDGSAVDPKLPRYTADAAAPYAHPYFWAPFILMGNWL